MATIGGYPVRKLIRNCYLSALLGVTSGVTYKQLKHYPQKIKKIVVYSSVPGCTGFFLGCCYGYFSKKGIILPGLKGAGNFFLISCSFLGINEALKVNEFVKNEVGATKKHKFIEKTISSSVTGFIVGSFWWRNPISFLTTAAAFGAIAGTGQLISDKIAKWRIQKAIMLQYPELVELEWLALDVEEQETIQQKNQSWFVWAYEKMLDKPLIGKLKVKQKELLDELVSLDKEESDLLHELGLEEKHDHIDRSDGSIVK